MKASNEIYEATTERLAGYSIFSNEDIVSASSVAAEQAQFSTYQAYLDDVDVHMNLYDGSVDVRRQDEDPDQTIVMHLSMANPLNPHNRFGVAAVASMFPNSRLLAFGNPAEKGFGYGVLGAEDRKKIRNGDFTPATERVNRKLVKEHIEMVTHVGGSYGAELAMTTAATGDVETDVVVSIEPVNSKKRILGSTGLAFAKSGGPMQGYMDANGLDIYTDAVDEAAGFAQFAGSIAFRATNLAIAKGLSQGRFMETAADAMRFAERLVVAWGSESELSNPVLLRNNCDRLEIKHGSKRVNTIEVPGGKHAMLNDLALQNAIISAAIRR